MTKTKVVDAMKSKTCKAKKVTCGWDFTVGITVMMIAEETKAKERMVAKDQKEVK